MKRFTVNQVARLSGVTVRTLHFYDETGLLKPAYYGDNGYRYYEKEQLLTLQQILFYRELNVPLEQIKAILGTPGFDRLGALKAHRARLENEVKRHRQLLRTIDGTIAELEGAKAMASEEMFSGFSPEKQKQYEKDLVDRFGPGVQSRIDDSKRRVKGWTKADFEASTKRWNAFPGKPRGPCAETARRPTRPMFRRSSPSIAPGWSNTGSRCGNPTSGWAASMPATRISASSSTRSNPASPISAPKRCASMPSASSAEQRPRPDLPAAARSFYRGTIL